MGKYARDCAYVFPDGQWCAFPAFHIGSHITRAEWRELQEAIRPGVREPKARKR